MQARYRVSLVLAALLVSTWLQADNNLPGPPLEPYPESPQFWSKSEGMQVQTLPDGRYRAEIQYQDQDNVARKFTFEGTEAEIRTQIQQNNQLPEARKQALLQSLNPNPGRFFSQPWPGSGGNPFNEPFFQGFQGDPFDSPLFKGFQGKPFDNPPFQGFQGFNGFQGNPFDDDFFRDFFQGIPAFIMPPGITPFAPDAQVSPPAVSPSPGQGNRTGGGRVLL